MRSTNRHSFIRSLKRKGFKEEIVIKIGLYDLVTSTTLESNKSLVNYEDREQANKTYTSQVAESHIDALINARHKRTKKIQWTREGAHHVLQIRAMMASDEWESKGQDAVLIALRAAA